MCVLSGWYLQRSNKLTFSRWVAVARKSTCMQRKSPEIGDGCRLGRRAYRRAVARLHQCPIRTRHHRRSRSKRRRAASRAPQAQTTPLTKKEISEAHTKRRAIEIRSFVCARSGVGGAGAQPRPPRRGWCLELQSQTKQKKMYIKIKANMTWIFCDFVIEILKAIQN